MWCSKMTFPSGVSSESWWKSGWLLNSFILWLFVSQCANTSDVGSNRHVIRLGVVLPEKHPNAPWTLPKILPAINIAVDMVLSRRNLLPGYQIEVHTRGSECSATHGPQAATDMYQENNVNVFFGPVCDEALTPVARLCAQWNIPILTVGGLDSHFENKEIFSHLTRMVGPTEKLGEFLANVFDEFNWMIPGLIYHKNDDWKKCANIMKELHSELESRVHERNPNQNIWYKEFDEEQQNPTNISNILTEASLNARVFVLCAGRETVREMMIAAAELNYDNGEYVFLDIDLFSQNAEQPWYRQDDNNQRNDKARQGYESVMTVTLLKPDSQDYRMFSREVKRRARQEFEEDVYGDDEEVNSIAGAFHDAIVLYVLALNETLAAGHSITHGREITQQMWDQTFSGISGTVSIDENGDRNSDYSLMDLNPVSGVFEVVAYYYGNRRFYEPIAGKKIHWAGNRTEPPPDIPECGFDGLECSTEKTISPTTGGVAGHVHHVQALLKILGLSFGFTQYVTNL